MFSLDVYERTSLRSVLFAIFVTSTLLSLPFISKADSHSILVRVTAEAYEELGKIDTLNTIDYGAFVWLEMSPENFSLLEQSGVPFEQQRNPHELQFQGESVEIGPVASQVVASSLSILGSEPLFQVVQLLGPAKDSWITDLEKSGVEILQYVDPQAYLVRMTVDDAASVASLPFVRGIGEYLPKHRIASELLTMEGVIEYVSVAIYDDQKPGGTVSATIAAIEGLGGVLAELEESRPSDKFAIAQFSISAEMLDTLAGMRDVAWMRFRAPFYPDEDEMSSQINAGNFNPLAAGYQTWLTNVGFNGSGITIAALDRGYDTGVDATAHADISGRSIMVSDSVGIPTDQNGHGSHVGGIMAGNASLGSADASSFLMGMGVAPQATLVVRRRTVDSDQQQTTDAVQNGAIASNHSYGLQTAGSGYSSRDRTYDMLVRDADTTTPNAQEPLIIVFSAGNSGTSGPSKEAKNVIAVGSTRNQRDSAGNPGTGNINTVDAFSSRGPAGDGRLYPHVSAPGGNIISTRYSAATSCTTIAVGAPAADPTYSMCSGTSMAAPHVTGSIALVAQWWQSFNAGAVPSPAMAKALLVNGAVDIGTADIPNNNEGWGRVNLDAVINSGIATEYLDQATVFGTTGASWTGTFAPADPGQQVRITLAWSDAPGAAGASPALVNDLDLVVTDETNTFLGNVFASGLSTTGGTADTLNNLENVYIASPASYFTITINAAAINGDGIPGNSDSSDQDFALVCTNCVPNVPPVCDAGGPYIAECAFSTNLDGTGSFDPNGDPLNFSWTGPFVPSPATGSGPSVVFPTPTGAKVANLEVDDGLASTFCAADVTVQDTLVPSITAPGNITAECAAPAGTPVDLGSPTVADHCDANPTVINDGLPLYPPGATTVTWTATDDDSNQGIATQDVTIQDTLAPDLMCNSPATIVPKDATVSFSATAEDQCAGPLAAQITSYDCYTYTKKGRRISKLQSCVVSHSGDTISIQDSGGRGDIIEWSLEATDPSGNRATTTCSVEVARPPTSNR